MSETSSNEIRDLHLAKLGIREIRQRIEVSPILTDPGTAGLTRAGDGTKSYICTIGFPDLRPFVGGE